MRLAVALLASTALAMPAWGQQGAPLGGDATLTPNVLRTTPLNVPMDLGTGAISATNVGVDVTGGPYFAHCDGSTDDTAAILAALAGNAAVTTPFGRSCYSATGITVPNGDTLRGTAMIPSNPPVGSEILCAANIAACVSTTANAPLTQGATIENLIIATNASSAPTAGKCFYADESYNVNVNHVMAYNCYDGFYWYDGLGGHMEDDYSGKISDAHIVQDTWAELRIHLGRFGMNGTGDLSSVAYIRITGGVANCAGACGPNTLAVSNTQFNQGGGAFAQYFLQFVNHVTTDTGNIDFSLDTVHVEGLSSAFVYSDSTWGSINYLKIANSQLFESTVPFWSLNAATSLNNSSIVGNQIFPSSFDLTSAASTDAIAGNGIGSEVTINTVTQENDISLTGNQIGGILTLTSPSASSTLTATDNTTKGISLSGAWASLSVVGGDIRTGSLTNTATGNVNVMIPGHTAMVNGTAAVSCTGSPTSSYVVTNGIVTHC